MNPYSLLSRLPLFQGMSSSEFDEVIAHVRLGFSKSKEGECIASEGECVEGLVFVLNGNVEAKTYSDDRGFSVRERLFVPCVLQPERLFGLTQRYSSRFTAASDCQLLTISKNEVTRLTTNSEVFRLNFLNILCTQTQRMQHFPWRHKPDGIRRKIAVFIADHCLRPAGYKEINIDMVRLGHEISESRLNVSRELKSMQAEGLILTKRERITIPQLERLL